MPGEPVNEIVLATVRLIGDNHNITAIRQCRMAVTLLLGQELLDRCEDHTSGLYPEFLPQVSPTLCLNRRLAEQVLAAREGAK